MPQYLAANVSISAKYDQDFDGYSSVNEIPDKEIILYHEQYSVLTISSNPLKDTV
jgi:predicted PolB exonuclease-like 3'-5' exonuclease